MPSLRVLVVIGLVAAAAAAVAAALPARKLTITVCEAQDTHIFPKCNVNCVNYTVDAKTCWTHGNYSYRFECVERPKCIPVVEYANGTVPCTSDENVAFSHPCHMCDGGDLTECSATGIVDYSCNSRDCTQNCSVNFRADLGKCTAIFNSSSQNISLKLANTYAPCAIVNVSQSSGTQCTSTNFGTRPTDVCTYISSQEVATFKCLSADDGDAAKYRPAPPELLARIAGASRTRKL